MDDLIYNELLANESYVQYNGASMDSSTAPVRFFFFLAFRVLCPILRSTMTKEEEEEEEEEEDELLLFMSNFPIFSRLLLGPGRHLRPFYCFSLFCFCLFRRSVCVYTRRRKKLLKFRLCNQRSSSVFIGWRHYVKMQLKSRWRWRNSRSSHTPSPPSWELKGLRVNSWSLHYSPPRGLRSWWSQLGRRTSVCVWSLSTSSIWDRRSSHTPRASRQQFRISISSSYTLQ